MTDQQLTIIDFDVKPYNIEGTTPEDRESISYRVATRLRDSIRKQIKGKSCEILPGCEGSNDEAAHSHACTVTLVAPTNEEMRAALECLEGMFVLKTPQADPIIEMKVRHPSATPACYLKVRATEFTLSIPSILRSCVRPPNWGDAAEKSLDSKQELSIINPNAN